MNIKQKTGLAVGAAVIGVGAVLGVGYAMAGTSGHPGPQASRAADGSAPGGRDGSRGLGNLAAPLAEKLGLDETTVAQALQDVMQANRPGGGQNQGTAPSAGTQPGGDGRTRTDRDAALAKALAAKLGVDEAKVTAALAEIRSEQQAGRGNGGEAPAPQPSATA